MASGKATWRRAILQAAGNKLMPPMGGTSRSPAAAAGDMAEDTLMIQVHKYLVRLRGTVPFPCSLDAAYFGMVPKIVKQWAAQGMFKEGRLPPGRESNMLSSMFATFEVKSAHGHSTKDVLVVSADSAEVYQKSIGGNDGLERVFWFEAPAHVPSPRNPSRTPFFLPKDHPQHELLQDWVTQALKVEGDIAAACRVMSHLDHIIGVRHIQMFWPKLMHFVRQRNTGMIPPKIQQDAERWIKNNLPVAAREEIEKLLATATLLPEPKEELKAWVGFKTIRHTGV